MSSVDVIVPCYGYGHFLRECVESVLSQSIQQLRVLIIDDASPDNTTEVATELVGTDPRVALIRHTANKGHIQTYNEGIEWTSAKYSLLLSADDYLLPGSLRRATALLEAHPEAGFVFGSGVELKSGGVTFTATSANAAIVSITGGRGWRLLNGLDFFRLVAANAATNIVPTPTALVKTELQKRVGGYRADLPHAGDLEMWLRLAAHSPVGVIADYQAVSRLHGHNMQNQYYGAKHLPDLLQRAAAFECVFKTCGHMLPQSHDLHRRLLTRLAYEALGHASSAFNDDDERLCEELCHFATGLEPEITRSLQWIVVQSKRKMGLTMCRTLLPLVTRVRHLMPKKNSARMQLWI